MYVENQIFSDNELEANNYVASCLRWSAVVVISTWVLTYLHVFVTDISIMNISGTMALILLGIPCVIQRRYAPKSSKWKYAMMLAFIFGISVLSAALSMHLILAWACPIFVACHYYSPKFTRFSFLCVQVCMFISFFLSILIGVWDSNLFMSTEQVFGVLARLEAAQAQAEVGIKVFQRSLVFFYLPRAAILTVLYITSTALSKRTNNLILKNRNIERQHQAMETELNVATNIQASMLPSIFPAFPGREEFDIFASMIPAKEVGGDFYDFFLVDEDHLAMVIADVAGKGVPASLFMVISKTLIKNASQQGLSPKQVLETVNNQLCEGNDAQMFVTVWMGIYEISTGKLIAANAGHEYPAIAYDKNDFELYRDKHGFVLAGMENTKYREYEMQLSPGDILFVYTDGVPEATDGDNQLFGTERMLTTINSRKEEGLEELLQGVKKDVDVFVGDAPQFDDLTMLALKIKSFSKED